MTAGIPSSRIDTSKPHPARVYDWLLGGKDNYPVDQAVGGEAARRGAGATRRGTGLSCSVPPPGWPRQGIDQFLDIGTGIPTSPNLHQIVQADHAASARVVYADNDPIVLRHAEALLVSHPEGATDYIHADVRQPEAILEHAGDGPRLRQPVALSLIALMHFLPDEQDPYGITRTLVDALPSGSYLVLSHGTADQHPELRQESEYAYKKGDDPAAHAHAGGGGALLRRGWNWSSRGWSRAPSGTRRSPRRSTSGAGSTWGWRGSPRRAAAAAWPCRCCCRTCGSGRTSSQGV